MISNNVSKKALPRLPELIKLSLESLSRETFIKTKIVQIKLHMTLVKSSATTIIKWAILQLNT